MLVDDNGRQRSTRTREESLALVQSTLSGLTDDERELLDALFEEARHGRDGYLRGISEANYIRKPITMKQFIEDEYYLGESCRTLYPQVAADLIEIAETPGIREILAAGSIGWGKTTLASVIVCWQLYLLSCLHSPQEAFGLSPGSEMVIVLLSKNLHLARQILKTAVEEKLKLSPYFKEHFPMTYGADVTKFPNSIIMQIASVGSERVLGANVFGGAMDEVNFMAGKKRVIKSGASRDVASFDMAEKVYGNMVRRIKSRFLKAGGDLPGMMVLLSSATTHGSFTERKIKSARTDPSVFVRSYATWDVKDDYSGEKFYVAIGSSTMRSTIMRDPPTPADLEAIEMQEGMILDVPIEYWEDFQRDLEGSVRDIAGIATHAISAFINRIETVEACVARNRLHPFSVEEYTTDGPGEFKWDLLCREVESRLPGGYREIINKPKRNPGKGRWVHIDPALSGDSLGIAMGHIERDVEVIRRDEDGREFNDTEPYIVMDFMLRVNPPAGEQIFLGDVRRLVYELQDNGFPIIGVSCDSYQSADTLQQVKRRGMKAELISVDSTTKPYDRLKACLYESRIEYYDYEPFKAEVKALERDQEKGKVDHPVAGSKDVSDAVAGVVHGLIEFGSRAPMGMALDQRVEAGDDSSWVMDKKARLVTPKKWSAGDLSGVMFD